VRAGWLVRWPIEPDLVEWNYGTYEVAPAADSGRAPRLAVSAMVARRGVARAGGRGPTGDRRVRAIGGRAALLERTLLRVFAARWLGLEPGAAALLLGTLVSARWVRHDGPTGIRLWKRGLTNGADQGQVRGMRRRHGDERKEGGGPSSRSSPGHPDALLRQYGSGPVDLTAPDALYERHLLFDKRRRSAAPARERYGPSPAPCGTSSRQRWVRTEQTYQSVNPRRVYYLSMEFLIGRSRLQNITICLLSPS